MSCVGSGCWARISGHATEDGVVTADARPLFIIIFLCVAHFIEFGLKEGGGGRGGEREEREGE